MAARYGPVTLIALVVANMIGAGVFTTSGFALADLGTPGRVMLAWSVGGGLAICGALSYGALARRLTESGGEYLFLSRVLHPAAGFVAGWVSLLAGFTAAIAFAATAFETYLGFLAWPRDAVAVATVCACGLAHGLALRFGALAQTLLVGVKLMLLLAIVLHLLVAAPVSSWQGGPLLDADGRVPAFAWSAFALSVTWISLSYSGFNAAVYVAGEAHDARRNVARAMVIGTTLVTGFYLVMNTILVFGPPPALIAGQADVAAVAARALGGDTLVMLVRVVAVLALASSVSAMIMAGPRVYTRMADDGYLPRIFSSHASGPRGAIGLQVMLACVVIVISDLRELLSYLGFTLSISAAITVASLFVLRTREGAAAVPAPGYPWIPAFYVLATLGFAALAGWRRPLEPVVGLATIVLGGLAWWMLRGRATAASSG